MLLTELSTIFYFLEAYFNQKAISKFCDFYIYKAGLIYHTPQESWSAFKIKFILLFLTLITYIIMQLYIIQGTKVYRSVMFSKGFMRAVFKFRGNLLINKSTSDHCRQSSQNQYGR